MATHDRDGLFGYLAGNLTPTEKAEVEKHIEACSECRDYLSFAGGLKAALKGMTPGALAADTSCPETQAMVAFAAGQLGEEEAQLVRKHAVFCKECLQELALLRQTTKAAGIRLPTTAWGDLLERLKGVGIDLLKTYGPGSMVGPVRIVAEQPVFAARGREFARAVSKVLEVQINENAYSVEVKVSRGNLTLDVAGFRTPLKAPLDVSVRSELGNELIAAQTDTFGNGHFNTPLERLSGDTYVLTLTLEGAEHYLAFRFAGDATPL
jgi:hypothetical protein